MDFESLQSLHGVHKIFTIRNGKRQTCFVSVRILEEVEVQASTIDWNEVRIDTFRSGGKGGQHQNVTDSGVRMVHEPTGLTVVSRSERSQYVNKESCRTRLATLYAEYQLPEKDRVQSQAKFGHATHQYWEHDIKKVIAKLM